MSFTLRRLFGVACFLAAVASAGLAAEPAPRPLTSFPELWQAERPPAALQVHPVRLEVVVLFHDPLWRSLWARCGDTAGYLGFTDDLPQANPGDRLLIEAEVQPAESRLLKHARFTPLGDPVPLPAIDAQGRLDDAASLHAQIVTVEGVVDRQLQKDLAHVTLEVVSDGRLITLWMPHRPEAGVPQLENAVVRATGVFCATANPSGQLTRLELCVHSPRDLRVIGWLAHDERFASTPRAIGDLAAAPPSTPLHVAGVVRALEPGRSVTLRDETGEVTVFTAQTSQVALGESFEAVGVPAAEGAEHRLLRGLLRPAQLAATPARELPRLRFSAQLRDLTPADAERGYPVELSGVVTWSHPDADRFFIVDASGGVAVQRPANGSAPPAVGEKVELGGVTAGGPGVPYVQANSVHRAGNMDLPEAPLVGFEQTLGGAAEAQWVTMVGFVRNVTLAGPWQRLELGTPAGTFEALLPAETPTAGLLGSVLRLRGVCSLLPGAVTGGTTLLVPAAHFLSIEEPAPADPFAVPERSLGSLRLHGSLPPAHRRVRVSGIVTAQVPGRLLHVQDGSANVVALCRAPVAVAPGDRVEVVGFPQRQSVRVVLHEALVRRIDRGATPPPLPLAKVRPIDPAVDGRLVSVEGELLEVSAHDDGTRLTLQSATGLLEATIDRAAAGSAPWLPGSSVALTGVYEVQMDEYNRPSSALLRLRTAEDVVVRRRPPLWTVRRTLAICAVLALAAVAGLTWSVVLRRRVQRQTDLIRQQFEKEKAARFETSLIRASKLESLGLLASGIAHDFNNLLTVVICNLSLVRLGQSFDPETEHCLDDSTRASLRARDLTLQLLTFAKGGTPELAPVALPPLVRESGDFACHGSAVRCVYDFADDLWPARADKAQVGQIIHNLVLNAVQAMPQGGVILLGLRNSDLAAAVVPELPAGRYVQLTIVDEGTGIPPEILPRIFEPYYTTKQSGNGLGLATVHSIIRRHHGQIEVASALGKGTTFTLWLPAAAPAPGAATTATALAPPPPLAGRILFMDDNEDVRRSATHLFQRLGLESHAVADGEAAIREYTAARAAGRPFSAVVLELNVTSGLGAVPTVQRLRAVDPDVCALVSNAYADDPVVAHYHEHGFAAHIRKPFDALAVAHALARVLPLR